MGALKNVLSIAMISALCAGMLCIFACSSQKQPEPKTTITVKEEQVSGSAASASASAEGPEAPSEQNAAQPSVNESASAPFRGAHYDPNAAFYGIWVGASKSLLEAENLAQDYRDNGNPYTEVLLTSDWSNLNPEPWYVITLDRCVNESTANEVLASAKSQFPDAYVKYTGDHR